jgi:glycosyltransferase involved in cell wall biosynthesis
VRIAVLHSFYDRKSPSGENSVVEDQVAQLRAVGHEVELIARYSDELGGSRLYPVKAALGAATQRGAEPSSELEKFRPDVIHCHNLFPNWGSQWLSTWAAKTVVTVHNYRSVCAAATLHRQGQDCQLCPQQGSWQAVKHKCYRDSALATAPLAWASRHSGKQQRLINEAKHLIFLNDEAATTMTGILGPREHSVIPNFVAQSVSHSAQRYSPEKVWLYAGRLTQEKGILTLMEHWPRHRRLKIVGAGPLKAEVQWVAEREPLTFTYSGIVPRNVLLQEIDASFALVIPSLWKEGLPTVVLEALAAHKPVLLSQFCSATPDLVAKGGVLAFNPHGEAGIATAAQAVEDDHDGLCRQTAATYEKYYSPEAWTAQVEPVYETVAGAPSH